MKYIYFTGLAEHGVFQQSAGHFALDSTDLETTEHYTGAGKKRVTVRKRDKRGKLVEVVEYKYGFKLVVIYEVHLRLIVAAKVVPINHHESNFTLELLQQAIANVGEGVIQVLLMDRGFLDGEGLWTIKHIYHVDFIVPAKDNMDVAADARSFLREKPDGEYLFAAERAGQGEEQEGQVKLIGLKGLLSYDQYGDAEHQKRIHRRDFEANPINVIVVIEWEGKGHKAGEEPVFLTSLPVDRPLEVLDSYDLRSLIENCAFRELKQGWPCGIVELYSTGLAGGQISQEDSGSGQSSCVPDPGDVQYDQCLPYPNRARPDRARHSATALGLGGCQ